MQVLAAVLLLAAAPGEAIPLSPALHPRSAPVVIEPSLRVDVSVVAGIAALQLGAWAADRARTSDPCPCDPAELPGFDRISVGRHDRLGAKTSDLLQYGSIVAAPLAALAIEPGSPRERVITALIVIEAMSAAGSTTGFLKSVTHRPRPHDYGFDATAPYDYHSFPSGHTTAAFSAASSLMAVAAMRRPDSPALPWIAGGGIAVAAATGFLRVESGHHFPSDVIAGAAIGSALGAGIPLLHERSSAVTASPSSIAVSIRF